MKIYYNDNDKQSAAWTRELIRAGVLPPGEVDDRSIKEVRAGDLVGFTQCHFFSGIGGWAYALGLAGWPADRSVWTGSCPCQPFSAAGQQRGAADERHLWPDFFRLIAECRPATVFGEQVASKLGREWLAGVFADLESVDYAVAGADLCAAGVGAPHIRQRLYWLADASWAARERNTRSLPGTEAEISSQDRAQHGNSVVSPEYVGTGGSAAGGMAHAMQSGRPKWRSIAGDGPAPWSSFDSLQCTDGKARRIEPGTFPLAHGVPARVGRLRGYGNAIVPQVAAEFVKGYLDVDPESKDRARAMRVPVSAETWSGEESKCKRAQLTQKSSSACGRFATTAVYAPRRGHL